jgi:hypothetical protein
VAGLAISHPDKVWWPDDCITKLDVVRYYAEVEPHLRRWMKGRLLTAEHCPDGMRGSCFYPSPDTCPNTRPRQNLEGWLRRKTPRQVPPMPKPPVLRDNHDRPGRRRPGTLPGAAQTTPMGPPSLPLRAANDVQASCGIFDGAPRRLEIVVEPPRPS